MQTIKLLCLVVSRVFCQIIYNRIFNYSLRVYLLLFCLSVYPQIDNIFRITTSRSNTLYVGIDNIMVVSSLSPEITLTTDNGLIFREKGEEFFIIPAHPGTAVIRLININKNHDTLITDSIIFPVKRVPSPVLMLDSIITSEDTPLSLRILRSVQKIGIYITDDIIGIENWYTIAGFDFGYKYGNNLISFSNEGNTFSPSSKEAMKKILPGYEIVFRLNLQSNNELSVRRPTMRFTVY